MGNSLLNTWKTSQQIYICNQNEDLFKCYGQNIVFSIHIHRLSHH